MEQRRQKYFENELKRSFLAEVNSSVEKCLEWLCTKLMTEIQTEKGTETLQQIIGFLMHVDSHYIPGTLVRAIEVLKVKTVFESKALFELYEKKEKIIWTNVLTNIIIDDVVSMHDKLKIADQVFENSDLKLSYTGVIHENLYTKCTEALGFVMSDLANETKSNNPENVTLLIKVYTSVNNLMKHLLKHIPEAKRELLKTEGSDLWIGSELFEAFLRTIESKHQKNLDSWLENCDSKPLQMDDDPVLKYAQEMLEEWEKLTWIDGVQSSFDLIRVCRKQFGYLTKGIFERGKNRSWYCASEPFQLTLPMCNMLNRMQSLIKGVKMICERTESCLESEKTGIMVIEVGKLHSDTDSLHDIYEIIQQKIKLSIRHFMKMLSANDEQHASKQDEFQSYLSSIKKPIKNYLEPVPRQRLRKSVAQLLEDIMLEISDGTHKYLGSTNSNTVEYILENAIDDMSEL